MCLGTNIISEISIPMETLSPLCPIFRLLVLCLKQTCWENQQKPDLLHAQSMRSWSKSCKMICCFRWKVMVRSGHNLAHAMTAQLSWHVQNYELIWSLVFMLQHHMILGDSNCEFMNTLWYEPQLPWSGSRWLAGHRQKLGLGKHSQILQLRSCSSW